MGARKTGAWSFGATLLLTVAAVSAAGCGPSQQAKIVPADAGGFDNAGMTVAISGETLVMGSPLHNLNQGAAWVYKRTGTTWNLEQELTAADGQSFDAFGFSVAISGDTVVVGANGRDQARGAAYVFTRSGTVWSPQQTLTADDAAVSDFLGDSVAISGDTVIVGASAKDSAKGAAYVFTRSGTNWTQQQTLVAEVPTAGDGFGGAVAVEGDTAVVGATQYLSGPGTAFVFTRSGVTWTRQPALTGTEVASGDVFGASVAISAGTVLVGAPGDFDRPGAAYLFTGSGADWSEAARLLPEDPADADYFGRSVAISGDSALVGASGVHSGQGACCWFTGSDADWSLDETFEAGDKADGAAFGAAMGLSGTTAVFGAPQDGSGKGAAYVFIGLTPAKKEKKTRLVASDGLAGDYFGEAAAISGDTLLVGALVKDSYTGAAYVFTRWGTDWTQKKILAAPDGAPEDRFGWAVALSEDANTAWVGAPLRDSENGSVYRFTRSGTDWVYAERLDPPAGGGTRFGSSLAVSGDTLVVGNFAGPAPVEVYTRTPTGWTHQATLQSPILSFGAAVAISGGTVVVGALGRAFVFTRSDGGWSEGLALQPSGPAKEYDGFPVAISGGTVVLGGADWAWLSAGNPSEYDGRATVFTRSGTTWTQQATIDAGVSGRGRFGSGVAISGGTIAVSDPDTSTSVRIYQRSGGSWNKRATLAPSASDWAGGIEPYTSGIALSGPRLLLGTESADTARGAAYVFPNFVKPTVSAGSLQGLKVKARIVKDAMTELDIKGNFDTGGRAADFSGTATLEVGDLTLDIPGFDSSVTTKGTVYSSQPGAGEDAGDVTITVSTPTPSHGTISIRLPGDVRDRVDLDGRVRIWFTCDAHVMKGSVDLQGGKVEKYGVTDPQLYARKCLLAFDTDGNGRTYKIELGFATDGVAPGTAPTVRLAINGADSGEDFGNPDAFKRKKNTWSSNESGDELTAKAKIDYAKGVITLSGKFPLPIDRVLKGGADSATMDLLLTLDGRPLGTSFEVVRVGTKAPYKVQY